MDGAVEGELAGARVGERQTGVEGAGDPGEEEEGAGVRAQPLVGAGEGVHRRHVPLHADDRQSDGGDEDAQQLGVLHQRTEKRREDPLAEGDAGEGEGHT